MKKYRLLYRPLLFVLLAVSLQSCQGFGNTTSGGTFTNQKGSGSSTIGINSTTQAIFTGKIYFTLDHNLYVLDGTRVPRQLTHGMTVTDPAVSPDGKWVAFSIRYKNYSDLAYMSVNTGSIHIVATGNGVFSVSPDDPNLEINSYYWFEQPSWSSDSKNLLFLSDLQKNYYWNALNRLGTTFPNSYFSDLEVFSLPIGQPKVATDHVFQAQAITSAQVIAYADFGDGGDRDAAYRPKHNDQIIYTRYTYAKNDTDQLIQLMLEDPNAIANSTGLTYYPSPGAVGNGSDPAVALTPPDTKQQNMQSVFSPDGNSVAYIRRQDATHTGLYVMPVANDVIQNPNDPATATKALVPYSKSVLLMSQQYISQPFWSPDGKHVGYLSYSNNVFDIWLGNVSVDKTGAYKMTGTPIQLTDAGGHLDGDSRPVWTA